MSLMLLDSTRLRWLVVVCTDEGQFVDAYGCANTTSAVALHRDLELLWPADHTISIGTAGSAMAGVLDQLADRLDAVALAGDGRDLSETDRARRDGIAAAAIVVREHANAIRRWAPSPAGPGPQRDADSGTGTATGTTAGQRDVKPSRPGPRRRASRRAFPNLHGAGNGLERPDGGPAGQGP